MHTRQLHCLPMIVLPPPLPAEVSLAQVLVAAAAVALTSVVLSIARSIRRKVRASKLLAPVPGPKGQFLVGFVPELIKNMHRVHDFQVCSV